MSDDFTKQLQENAVEKAIYESQEQKAREIELENIKLSFYREIIAKTKHACIEAVKTGAFSTNGNEKKVCGILDFYHVRNTDSSNYYYEKSLGVNIVTQGVIMAHLHPLKYSEWHNYFAGDEHIFFVIHEDQERDISSFIDKLRNKKRTTLSTIYKDDEKEILNFISLFQSKIANAKIISYSKIDFDEIKFTEHTISRIFDFEIVF